MKKKMLALILSLVCVVGTSTNIYASNLSANENNAYKAYLNDLKYEDSLKEEARKNSETTSASSFQEKDELDIAYENMIIRENYIVDLISRLSEEETSFDNWEFNLNYLVNNYKYLNQLDDVNMDYVDIYIETYENLKFTKDLPDEKKAESKVSVFSTYSRQDAVDYAYLYCYSYNPNYPDWGSSGGDCANFVSQALHAGGKSMKGSDSTNTGTAWEKNWFSSGTANSTTKVSPSWRGANAFKTYWQKNATAYKKFTSYTSDAYDYGYRGDAVSFLNSNGAAYHTLIIVSYDDGLVCAQHTGSNDARKLKNYTGDFIIYNMY